MPTDGIDISAFDAATSSTPKKIDISAFDAPSKSTPQQPSQPTTEGEKSTGEEDNVADPLQLLLGGGQKSEPDLSSPLSMMQYLSGNVTLPKEQPVAASLKGFKFSDEQLNTAKKKIEDMMFMVENDPLSNPISKVVTKSYLNSLLGAVSGAETIQKTPEVAQKEGKGAATLNLTAGLIREGFSLASLVSPNLAAFNAAVEGADRVTAGKVIPYIMSPFSTIIQKNNGYIYYNGRIYNLNSAGARGAAEIGDLVINAILFKAGEGATKYTAEQLKSLAEKVKENTTLNSDDVQMLNDVVGEAAKDFQKENNQLVYGSLTKIPKDIPDSKKVELSPLIEEKQKLDKQKEATDEAFHPQIDEQKAVIDNKINEIISQPKTEENAIQERSPEKEVSRPVETGENLTEGSEGVRPVIEGKETPEALTETKPKEEVGSNTLSEVDLKNNPIVVSMSLPMDSGVNTGLIKNSKGAVYHERNTGKLKKLGYSDAEIDNMSQHEVNEILAKNIENPNVESSAKLPLAEKQTTTNELINEAIKGGGHFSELAKALQKFFGLGDVETSIVKGLKNFFGGKSDGDYANNKIQIDEKAKNKIQTFLHEGVHKVTVDKLLQFERGDLSKLSETDIEAIKNLKRIFEESKVKIHNFLGGGKGDRTKGHYGFTDVHEFISEAFANPEFQRLLREIPTEGKSPTIFKQFLDAVAKLLGIKNPSILNDIFYHTEQLQSSKPVEQTTQQGSNTLSEVETKKDITLQDEQRKQTNGLSSTEDSQNKEGNTIQRVFSDVINRVHTAVGKIGKSIEDLRFRGEEPEIKRVAKEKGLWVDDPYKSFGEKPHRVGSEANVYLNKDGKTVTKLNSAVKYDTWQDYMDAIDEHNRLFPNEPYTVKGFTELGGDLTAIVEQPVIRGKEAKFSEVKKDMAAKGFEHIPAIENPETKYDFRNDEGVVISDIHGRNVIKDENGNLRYIDTVIRKPKQEQKSESKNPSEIGIAGKKNEKQGFSDNENVSNIDERKQFAIDFVVNDLLPKGADVRTEKMGGIGKRTSAVTESRLDLGMTSAEKNKAIDDIKKGNYETAPAKKLINKLGEFYDADEFPHIKGTGGNTIRDFAATRQEILDAIDEAKIYKENRKIAKQYEPNLTPDARRLLENDNLFTTSDGRKQFLEKLDDEQWVNDNLKSFPKEFTNEDIQSLKETLNDIENGKADFIQEENSAGQSHITIKYREPRTKAETEATASAEPTKQFIHQKGQQEPLRGEGKATRSQKGTVQETRTVGESEQKPLTEQSPKTKLQLAKERLAEAKKKADDAYRTSAIDPFEQKKRQAQADRELFDAYLDVAREYISETANKAFHTLKDFAKELGEDVNDKIEKAWNVATGKQKYDDAVKEFEAVSGKEELPNQPFSSAQKETEILREQLGIEPYERTPETLEQWNSEANQRIANGEMPQILDKMRSGEIPDDVEKVMLNKYINSLNEKVKTDPSDAILKQLKEAIQLNDKQNTEWGRLGRAIQERNDPIQTLGEAYVAKMEANGVDTLTDAQKAEVKAQFDKVNELKDKAEAKVRELEEKVAQLEAEKEVNKQKSKTTKTKKSHADYVAERKEIVGSIKEKLRKARGEMQATVIPYANELIAISPDVAKLMKSYIGEGIDKLTDLVAKIHADLKEDIPSITERDVRDIIAGKYNERKETKNELQAKLKDIRDEQKLIDKLEALNRGELPKTEREKIKRNQQISDLQKQIKEHDLTKLSEYKKRQLQAAAKLRERIEKGDFEPEKPKSVIESVEAKNRFPKEYNEALDALIEHEDARADFDIALLRDQKSKQGKLDKVLDIGKGIVATGKALKAGIDDSAIFVQNLFALLANKHLAGKAILGHWKDAVSERHYKQWLTQLHNNHELWNLIEKSGLDVTDPKSLRQSGREDVFSYNLLDKDVKIKGKKYNVGKYTLRPFERAFTSLGNRLRVYAFAEMAKKFQAEGKTFENSEKLYKDLANYLNNSTGRGKLHPGLQGADGLMSSVFWSPRLMASTFNLLGFGDVTSRRGFYRDMSPEIRRLAAKDAAHFIGTGVAVLGILALLGWETDMNPISTTFGSVTTPDKKKSYNIFGRFAAPVRTFAQMATGKRSVQGLTESIPANKRFIDLPLHYLRGRTTPLFGSAWTLASGKDYMGQPASLKKEALSNITPLSVGAFIQAAEKEGLKSILSTDVPSAVGINVSYADNFDKKVPTTIKAGEREVELTESQQKEFQDKFDLKSELYLTNLINTPEYNSATDEEKISLRRMVNRAAMNEAENELRIKYPKELKETPQERAARLKENAEEKKLKQKIGIGKRQSTPSESGSEIGEQ